MKSADSRPEKQDGFSFVTVEIFSIQLFSFFFVFLCLFVNFMQRFMGLIPSLQVSNLVNSGNFLI